jgi:hypothetical protein
MDQDEKKAPETPAEIEDLNIDPISDEDLDTVAGGATACTVCGWTGCCTTFGADEEEVAS